jgi:hypothetical protein
LLSVPRPLTASQLIAAADAAETEARRLEIETLALREQAALLRDAAAKASLQRVNIGVKVNTSMENVHRVAISRGRAESDPFLTAIQGHGFTLRSLAAAVEVSPATLSAHRKARKEPNSRPCPQGRASRICELTGWPADAKHWPAGLS